jgi:NAD(P)-dependent dehydrogenase (short-subunit alcohol dehydrogenase family)
MRLQEVAIVTGGVHGMGEAEARLFAAEGAKVIVADILEGDAEIVAADIQAGGEDATAAQIDVTSEAEWIGLIAKAVATYGRLDILVNNAGISGSAVGNPDGLEGWHRIIAVNQTSVFLGTKLAAEQMAKTGGGSIVNISSMMGFVGSTSGHPANRTIRALLREGLRMRRGTADSCPLAALQAWDRIWRACLVAAAYGVRRRSRFFLMAPPRRSVRARWRPPHARLLS